MSTRPSGKHAAPRSRPASWRPVASGSGGRHRAPQPPSRARSVAPRVLGVAALAVAGAGALSAGTLDVDAAATGGTAAVTLPAPAGTASGTAPAMQPRTLGDGQQGAGATARPRPERAPLERVVRVSRDAPRRAPAAAPAVAAWQLPIPAGGYRLTSRFGECSGLWSSCHTGLDFSAPSGTPVHAVAGGVVTETAYAGAYGNRVVLTLPDGTEVWFCHLTSFTVGTGQQVAAGGQVGTVGSTGNTTGPHLHLEVRPGGGDAVDPATALAGHGVTP